METTDCSIFSGANSDVCASVDLFWAPLEVGSDACSFLAEFILAASPVAGGWNVVAVGPLVVLGPGDGPVRGPTDKLLSRKLRGVSVWKISQVSEAAPGFLERSDAS